MADLRSPSAWAENDAAPEIERLLNPAFGAAVLATAVTRYRECSATRERGLPLLLAFVVLPLTLHGRTRQAIATHQRGYGLHRFVRAHTDMLTGLDQRVEGLRAFTQAAITFGTCHRVLTLDDRNLEISADAKFVRTLSSADLEVDTTEVLRAADRLGAWLAGLNVPQVFLVLQLTP